MTRARDELVLSHAADYGGRRARRVSPFVLEALDLPPRRRWPGRRPAAAPVERIAVHAAPGRPAEPAVRPVRRAALAELLPGRRLPDLPAQVPLRARRPGPDRAAPLDRLRGGPPPGRPGVPPPAGPRRGDEPRPSSRPRSRPPGRARASSPASTRRRGSPPDAPPCARFRDEQLRPGASSPPTSSASSPSPSPATGSAGAGTGSTSSRPTDGGRRGRGAVRGPEPRRARASRRHRRADAPAPAPRAGHDHRLQVERRPRPGQGPPAGARLAPADDLRDGLRGDDRATAGRRPAPLPRDRHRRPGEVDERRLATGRERIAVAAAGIRARDFDPTPDVMACTYCPYRDICPASARPVTAERARPGARSGRSPSTSATPSSRSGATTSARSSGR